MPRSPRATTTDPVDLLSTMRSTGAVRDFTDAPVTDEVLGRILESARFAPNGGNRQAWHVVVCRDPNARARLRELYVQPWREYLGQTMAGITPWSPSNDREAERRIVDGALASGDLDAFADAQVAGLFAAPVALAVFGDLDRLVATDRDLDRYTMVAGASVYPFVWNILLAARAEGLGGVITTMHARVEAEVKELLGAPSSAALACVVMLGQPVHQPTKLRRRPVAEFTTVDRFDGPALDV